MRLIPIGLRPSQTLKLATAFIVSFAAVSTVALPPAESATGEKKIASIESMVSGLEQRLEKEPNDAKGWVLLGKSYQYMNRIDEAKTAFDKAVKLGFTGAIPNLQGGNSQQAAAHHPHAKGYMNGSLASAITEVTSKEPAADTKAAANSGIKVKVEVSPELKKQLQGNETIFVFAKLPKGMPAPLAVGMKKVSDLPFEIVLDDNKSMIPGHNISSASEVIVGARISKGGNATRQSGDIEALSQAVPTSQKEAVVLKLSQ